MRPCDSRHRDVYTSNANSAHLQTNQMRCIRVRYPEQYLISKTRVQENCLWQRLPCGKRSTPFGSSNTKAKRRDELFAISLSFCLSISLQMKHFAL